ncbi:MAG: hypothetical protein FJW20_06790 [Acidimicrobiia bacterium]|nr:hypothetical protein [Acidimicrobiia bacterium]
MFPLLVKLFTLAISSAQVSTRAEQIEKAREEKTTRLEPDTPHPWEQRLIYMKDKKILERISAGIAGFRVKLGGMPTGGGFAVSRSGRRALPRRRTCSKTMRLARYIFVVAVVAATSLDGQRFYPDDPLLKEPTPRDASKAVRRKIS